MNDEIQCLIEEHGYLLGDLIGKGGFSEIYLLKSKKYFGMEFVGKIIKNRSHNDKSSLDWTSLYNSEVNLLKELPHPFIVGLYDFFANSNFCILVLEYCPNGSVSNYIKKNGGMDPIFLKYFIHSLFSALSFIHENNIAHHDIKPGNFLFDNSYRLKLSDFGLSKKYAKGILSTFRGGTIEYCAPEVLKGIPYDPFKADIWSAGVSIFKIATGYSLFKGSTKKSTKEIILSHRKVYFTALIDPLIKNVIERCLMPDPQQRPTAKELFDSLTNIKESKSTLTIQRNQRLSGFKSKAMILDMVTMSGLQGSNIIRPSLSRPNIYRFASKRNVYKQ